MVDSQTGKPILVSTESPSGPYIWVSMGAADAVQKVLQAHGIKHWLDFHFVSVDGEPAVSEIYLDRKCDPRQVQAILDAA
jgi:hypothetical protein